MHFLLCILFSVLSVSMSPEAEDMNLSALIRRIDKSIDSRDVHEAERKGKLEEIKYRLKTGSMSADDRWRECGRIVDGYLAFQTDTAMKYALLKKEYAIQTGDSLKILETDLNIAQIYSIIGLNGEASAIIDNIPSKWLTPFLSSYSSSIRSSIYESLYWSVDNEYLKGHYYSRLHDSYVSQLASQSPETDGSSFFYTKANILNLEGRYNEAREWLEDNAEYITTDKREEAIYWYLLAQACIGGAGTREEAECFFAMSAINDMHLGIKEHTSLLQLANMLYEDGDIARAYRYLKVSLEDAQYCNSQKRMLKASQLFPIVDNDYQIRRSRQQRNLYLSLGFSILLILLLIAAVAYISHMYGAKRRANEQLSGMNAKLKELNGKLSEANLIKETYIVQYIDYCLNHIDSMDSHLKTIARLLRSNDTAALRKAVDFNAFTRENLDRFYDYFDNTFLHLFPTFVEEYNVLLRPEERIVMKDPCSLNTELRIYALIRLGITDSLKIARFLHCSISTVYNNRTSARNKAAGDRNDFERKVAEIGIIDAHSH